MVKTLLSALECKGADVSLLLTDDEEIAVLNQQFRGKPKPTDVLSFPIQDIDTGHRILGDIVISLETAQVQASESTLTFRDEVLQLLIHGLLHLLGYEHEDVPAARVHEMREKEVQLFELLPSP